MTTIRTLLPLFALFATACVGQTAPESTDPNPQPVIYGCLPGSNEADEAVRPCSRLNRDIAAIAEEWGCAEVPSCPYADSDYVSEDNLLACRHTLEMELAGATPDTACVGLAEILAACAQCLPGGAP